MINPLLLWFLPLVALPILLHLLTRLRVRTVELPTFRFLMDGYVQQRRRLKLIDWLLLLLRTLFVLLIITALARPVADRWAGWFGAEGKDVVIVLDAGANMSLRSAGTTAMQRAQGAAEAVIGRLSEGDHVTVIRAAHRAEIVVRRFATQPASIVDRVRAIEPDITRGDVAGALRLVEEAERHGPRTVYVISDGRRAGWGRLVRGDVAAAPSADDRHVVLDVGSDQPVPNLAIVGQPPRSEQAVAGLPVRLTATIEAGDLAEPAHTAVSLIVGDRQVARRSVILEPGERRQVPFVFTPDAEGVVEGRFELPADAFEPDDGYRFSLDVKGRINVAAVIGDRQRAGERDARVYLEAALTAPLLAAESAVSGAGGDTDAERRLARSLAVTYLTEDQFREENLRDADVLVLANVAMNGRRAQTALRFIADGGGVVVLPGERARVDQYNAGFFEAIRPPGGGDPPVTFGDAIGDPDDESSAIRVTGIDNRHPIMDAFDDRDSRYFASSLLYRRLPLRVADAASSGATVARLLQGADGEPAAVSLPVGEGRLVVYGFPVTPDWTNLPVKPEFVPMLLRSIVFAGRARLIRVVPDVRPHEPAPIALRGEWADAEAVTVELDGPDGGTALVPTQRDVGEQRGVWLDTTRAGYYRFRVSRQDPRGVRVVERGFAVNPDLGAADLRRVDPADVRALFGEQTVYLQASVDDPVLAGQMTDRRELWRTLIWITLAVLAVEFVLSTLGGGRAAAAARGGDAHQKPGDKMVRPAA